MAKADSNAAKRQDGARPTKCRPAVNVNPGTDRDEGPGSLQPIAGSPYAPLNNVLTGQALAALWLPAGNPEEHERRYDAALAAMMEFKPADGIEGMMAVQAVGLHSAAMECLRRAMIAEQSFEVADRMRRQGANLSRAFLDVVAALDRKRGKGTQQVVRIERVVVKEGGQAIVGNVQAAAGAQHGEGVGHEAETEGEPHAPPARLACDAAVGTVLRTLQGADTGREPMPITRDEQRPLPDARGHLHGA